MENQEYQQTIGIIANWAAILTAAVAIYAYGRYRFDQWNRRRRLEDYLREEKKQEFDNGQRTVLHLMGHLSMTESEILSAAFSSKKVSSALSVDEQGRANLILFEYSGTDIPLPRRL